MEIKHAIPPVPEYVTTRKLGPFPAWVDGYQAGLLAQPAGEAVAWAVDSPHGRGYRFAQELIDAWPTSPPPAAPTAGVSEAMVERGAALSTSGRKDDPKYRAKIRAILEAALTQEQPNG